MAGSFDDLIPKNSGSFDDLIPTEKTERGSLGVAKDLALAIGGAAVSAVGAIPTAVGRAVQEAGRDVFGITQAQADTLAQGDSKKSAEYLEKANRFLPTELVGKGVQYLGDKINAGGKYLQEMRSMEAKAKAQNSQLKGNLTDPSTWSMGADPTPEGFVQNASSVVGSLAPMVATAVATRGKSLATQAKVGAGVGGAQVGGSAMSDASDAITNMTEEELITQSPVYAKMLQSGMPAKEARARLIRSAENMAGLQTAAIGAAGGAATGALLGGAAIGKARAGAILGTGAVSGLEGGTQEVLEGVSTRDAVNRTTGMNKPLMDGTFGEFVMGAVGGGAVGAGKGATRNLAVAPTAQADVILDAEPTAQPMAQAIPLALPAPRVVVNERGQAIREGQGQVFDEPAARVQGRTEPTAQPVQSQMAAELLALGYDPTPRAQATPIIVNQAGEAAASGETIGTAQRAAIRAELDAMMGITPDVRAAQEARTRSQQSQSDAVAQSAAAPTMATQENTSAQPGTTQPNQAQAQNNKSARPDTAIPAEQKTTAQPANPRQPASWVIREKATGNVVTETFERKTADAVNTEKYEAVPIQEHLASLTTKQEPMAQPQQSAPAAPREQSPPQPAKRTGGSNARRGAAERNPFMAFLGSNGVRLDNVKDFVPGATEQRKALVPGYGPVFRRSGMQLDMLAEKAVQEGYMQSEDVGKLYEMISRAISGKRIAPVYAQDGADDMVSRRVAEYQSKQDDAADSQDDSQQSDYDDLITQSLTDDQLFAIDEIDLDAPSNVTTEDAMRSLGFTEQDIQDDIAQKFRKQKANSPRISQPDETTARTANGEAAPRNAQTRAGNESANPTEKDLDTFSLDIPFFGNIAYKATSAAPSPEGGKILLSKIHTAKTKIGSIKSKEYGLPSTVYAWRTSVAENSNGTKFAQIEAMYKDTGRADSGEVAAYFKQVEFDLAPKSIQDIAGKDYGEMSDFLQQPTREDLAEKDERTRQVDRQQESAQRETEQRADADAQRDSFTLTGSDRNADVAAARGQDALFSNLKNPIDQETQADNPTPGNRSKESLKSEINNTPQNGKNSLATDELRTALEQSLLSTVDIRTVRPATGSSLEKLAKGIKATFGKEVSYYQSNDPRVPTGGARIKGNKKTLYVNIESNMPVQTVGHEMLHDLSERHNDLYQKLLTVLRKRVKDTKANKEELERGYGHRISGDLIEEENLADVAGYAFGSNNFWQIFEKSLTTPERKTFFEWIGQWLSSLISKAKRKIDISSTDGLQEAAKDMQKAVASVYAQAVRRDKSASSITADTSFATTTVQRSDKILKVNPLEFLAKTDELFSFPKSDKDTIEGIAADHDSEIKVRKASIPGNEVMYSLTMPDGTIARITERTSTPDSVYGAVIDGDNNYTWIKERPGDNAESLPEGIKDVWIDVSNMKPGQNGGRVYSIAAAYAHNTGAIFIGDPSGFSPAAMRRRPEQMLSSALKFGTTDHIAPHPDQVKGSEKLGIPPLKWVYGDNFGNIERLVELNVVMLDKEQPKSKGFKYDLDTGLFSDEGDGRGAVTSDLANLYFREMLRRQPGTSNNGGSESTRQPLNAGWRTLARGAVLRAILQRGRTAGDDSGRTATGRTILEGLVSQRDKLASTAKEERIFYSNTPSRDNGVKKTSSIGSNATKIAAPITVPLQAVNKATDKIGKEIARLTGIKKLAEKAVSTVENAVNSPSRWTWVERVKQGLVSDYGLTEEYLQKKIDKTSRENRQLRDAASTLDRLSGMSPNELAVAYQWLQESPDTAREKDLISRLTPEQQAVVKSMKDDIDRLSQEAVKLGLITRETFERNKFAYIHRSYKKYEVELTPNQLAARQRSQKIKGDQFKGRGMDMQVALDRIVGLPDDLLGTKVQMFEKRNADGKLLRRAYSVDGKAPEGYESAGTWEIRNAKGENATLWRDFTLAERQRMGEIEDARYGFAKTMLQGVRDIETARFLSWTASEYGKASADGLNVVDIKPQIFATQTFTQDEWVKVPETKIKGTQVLRYGDLAGQHIPGVLWNDLVGTMELKDTSWDKAVSAWKISKTALSPAVHVNNVMSNFVMADLADVGVNDIRRALETILKARAGDAKAKAIMERYEDSGAESGSFAANEIKTTAIEPLLKQIQQSEPEAVQKANLLHVLSLAVHGEVRQAAVAVTKTLPGRAVGATMETMIAAYQAEDSVFRIAKFVNEINAGKTDQQAGKAAREAFLDYNINAPWVRAARRTALPFISFTYRAVPLIAKTIATKPWKLAKYTALGYALNGLAYAMLGEAGDEEKEKRLLPEELQGKFIGLPKMVRLPWNAKDDHPMWLDVRRWLPAGDVTETNQSKASVPLPSWLSIGGPLSLLIDFYSNSNFKGYKVVQPTDTAGETIEKTLDMVLKFALPNLPAPGLGWLMRQVGAPVNSGNLDPYAWATIEKAMNDSKSRTGKQSDVGQSIINALGVKVQSRSMVDELANVAGKYKAQEREIKTEITRLASAGARNDIPKPEAERRIQAEIEKLQMLSGKLVEKVTAN